MRIYYTIPESKTSYYELDPGIYFLSFSEAIRMTDSPYNELGACIWIYQNRYGNERIGILLSSCQNRAIIGRQYGNENNKLSWTTIKFTNE